jgi:hypothetical protein
MAKVNYDPAWNEKRCKVCGRPLSDEDTDIYCEYCKEVLRAPDKKLRKEK